MFGLKKPKSRDPEPTRERLLKTGYREVYRSGFLSSSIASILLPLERSEDENPIDALISIVQAIPADPRDFHGWRDGVARALRRGQSEGTVRPDDRLRRFKLHHAKERNHDKHSNIAQEFARDRGLRARWSGGTSCGHKRTRRIGGGHRNRRSRQEVV